MRIINKNISLLLFIILISLNKLRYVKRRRYYLYR
uniref:Uncharacterized protein n=1 Tax=viral metagenome TaxID=1070528 RepID=A0A6C0DM60_9ZZZZ